MDLPPGVKREQIHTASAKGHTPSGAADKTRKASNYGTCNLPISGQSAKLTNFLWEVQSVLASRSSGQRLMLPQFLLSPPPLPSFPLLPPLPIHLENKNQSIELKAYSVLYIHNFFISLKPHMVVLTPSPTTSHSRCADIFLPLFDILILRNDSSLESSSGCCEEDPSLPR